MKNLLALSIILAGLVFTSCNKASDDPAPFVPDNSNCLVKKITHSSGDYEVFSYVNDRLVKEEHYQASNTPILTVTFTRDKYGKLLTKVSKYHGSHFAQDSSVYTYNSDGRLTQLKSRSMSCGWFDQLFTFEYTDKGILKEIKTYGLDNWETPSTTNPVSVTKYESDANGNILAKNVYYINLSTKEELLSERYEWTYAPNRKKLMSFDEPNHEFMGGTSKHNFPDALTYVVKSRNHQTKEMVVSQQLKLSYTENSKGYPTNIVVQDKDKGTVYETVTTEYDCK